MSAPRVVIVDYGLGNLFSVERALRYLGAEPVISSEPQALREAQRVILPGVGAFGEGMAHLRQRGLVPALREYVASGRALLGICLGMQLLMSESEEFGRHEGLDLVRGRVVRLRLPQPGDRFKVPHIGWNALAPPPAAAGSREAWRGTWLEGLEAGAFLYFLHSYVVMPEQADRCLAVTRYGHDTFCSVLRQDHVMGVQFHPERSGEDGLAIYRRFLARASSASPYLLEGAKT